MVNLENALSFKNLFSVTKKQNLDFRERKILYKFF